MLTDLLSFEKGNRVFIVINWLFHHFLHFLLNLERSPVTKIQMERVYKYFSQGITVYGN
jgi:hypothetical protein